MGLFASIGRFMAGESAVPTDPMDPRFWGVESAVTSAGVAVTADSALSLDVVQSVLGRLSGTISTLPMMVFKREADGSRAPAPDHPLYRLLHNRPNRFQTAQEFKAEQAVHLAFWRNAYSLIHPGPDGEPIGELEQLHPRRLKQIVQLPDGRRYYTFTSPRRRTGRHLPRRPGLAHPHGPADRRRLARQGGVRDLARDVRARDRGGAVRRALLRQRRLGRGRADPPGHVQGQGGAAALPGDLAQRRQPGPTGTRTAWR